MKTPNYERLTQCASAGVEFFFWPALSLSTGGLSTGVRLGSRNQFWSSARGNSFWLTKKAVMEAETPETPEMQSFQNFGRVVKQCAQGGPGNRKASSQAATDVRRYFLKISRSVSEEEEKDETQCCWPCYSRQGSWSGQCPTVLKE